MKPFRSVEELENLRKQVQTRLAEQGKKTQIK
ncbi:unnamed protein product, partial [marine sediment metagenome]